MDNKTNLILKTLVAGLACVTLCGTTLAAPHRDKAPQKAPMHQKAPMPKRGPVRATAHRPTTMPHHLAPAPRPAHHHGGHHEGAGWVTLGAALIGGLVGGLIGG